jgi:hypothetical protein
MCQTIALLTEQAASAKQAGNMELYKATVNEINAFRANLVNSKNGTAKTLVPTKKKNGRR